MNDFENLLNAFKRVSGLTRDLMRPKEDSEFNPAHMYLLFLISMKNEIKTTEIAKQFGVTPGAATGIADKLEKMGLIERQRKEEDRRVVVLTLTEKGKEFVEERKREHVLLYEEILKDFSKDELSEVIYLLNKIGDKMEDYLKKE